MPGSRISSVKLVCPVRSAGSSLRGTLLPMYRRAVSVMPRPPISFVLLWLVHLQEVLARVHGGLVLDEEPGDRAVLLGLDLVEGLHHLDQAEGVTRRDALAPLDVEVAVRVRAPV